jgi:hypothetical protein
MLAGGNHMAGVLLARIMHWSRYGRAEIPGTSGFWIANDRAWWMREACLTADQYDRSMSKLAKWKLVERRQWWFGGRKILFVRPTDLTTAFVVASKTWPAAKELLPDLHAVGQSKVSETADQSSAEMLISNGVSNSAELGPAASLNSNYIENSHQNLTKKEKLTSAPSCAGSAGISISAPGGDDKITHKALFDIWEGAIGKYHSDAVASGQLSCTLTPKEKGCIAEFFSRLDVEAKLSSGAHVNLRQYADHILTFCICNWTSLAKQTGGPPHPRACFLNDQTSWAVTLWLKSGGQLQHLK